MRPVVCGDGIEFVRSLSDESVQLLWTDPPYGTDRTHTASSGQNFDDPDVAAVVDLCERLGVAMQTKLRRDGLAVFCLDRRAVHHVAVKLGERLRPAGEIVWHHELGNSSKSWWSNKHDTLLMFGLGSPMFRYANVPKVRRKAPKPGYPASKPVASVWTINMSTTDPQRVGYPTQKPIGLVRPFIDVHTREGDLVVDPFCGSGTTLAAAIEKNRQAVGCDINPAAVQVANDRLAGIRLADR